MNNYIKQKDSNAPNMQFMQPGKSDKMTSDMQHRLSKNNGMM